ncbi:PAP fibrillin [Trichormus variabilis ATCC 29413]|uniref:PAP fibrillin n=2 Tax=Anabaena variabilis TaxID=264691 RepID=Q3MDP3_TRIV2|nr:MULTISPECIES: PAP/fibrillin family protein [Nostocaceae]ABA20893.1 PAP fibrillin [Trichormus variabilis ATCC 29413]MBC1213715.1 PAP/fibrillin family protein [Trichormus variabilis ARAD]MBC1254283.1 PAP/fibrillin family protein [Trichormus variabilis V5]MBC1267691.1 PAP/fibrillin family protein [Trichormus variabilis FSR]MBC1302156.1 PAP/fibrillin family protein [Trichormus variabilis N2B]
MLKKTALLDAIAGTNRGLLASEQQKRAILAAIATLEDLNPTPRPVENANLLDGNWRLLYTTSKALLNLDRVPVYKLGQIYQCIRVETTSVYNIAEIYGLPYLEGLVSVAAKFEPVSERRVQVKFQRSIVGLQRLIGYTSPEDFIQRIEAGKKFTALDILIKSDTQQGWLDITYIDHNLRIGRGNEGSVFVLSKT